MRTYKLLKSVWQNKNIRSKNLISSSYKLYRHLNFSNTMIQCSYRSSKLRRLRLSCCKNISGKGLGEAAKSFPKLEELHILFMNQVNVEDVEAIGIACSELRSFTLIKHDAISGVGNGNDYLVAISKVMPNLIHLRLGFFGSTITNRGYQAILDGCPLIESLVRNHIALC